MCRTFRDIYYITLSEDDDMWRDRLRITAHWMKRDPGEIDKVEGTAPNLEKSYYYYRSIAKQAIDSIANTISDVRKT